jgi:DNA-directed RNA polymerase beta subunit
MKINLINIIAFCILMAYPQFTLSAREVLYFVMPLSKDAVKAIHSVQKEKEVELIYILEAFGVSANKDVTRILKDDSSNWRIECYTSHANATLLLDTIIQIQYVDKQAWKSRDYEGMKKLILDAVSEPIMVSRIKEQREIDEKIKKILQEYQ